MAKLLKLHISGIRSFGPFEDQAQQIKFTSPLTLILGQNGCGKTTIIESIKYACSGDLPAGTNSGQGFVNDPKMSRSSATKGQIKLKFADPKGNEVTVCRVVEAAQSGTGLTFNTKSATIRIVNPDGSDHSVSGRCVDVTNECCLLMNVSAPVLNNVIFCHQENSSWPLDEGKKLKEKFDEIFDAQRYNKCAEVMRLLHKKRVGAIKILKTEMGYIQDKKEFVDKQKRILNQKEDRMEKFEENIRTKNEQLEPLKKRIDEILELERSLSDLQRQLTAKEATRDGVVEEQNTIRRSLAFEFEGNDEELQVKIMSFEEDRRKEIEMVTQLEKRKGDIENRSKELDKIIEETQGQLGKLKQEKNQYLKKCEQRNQLINKVNNEMKVKMEKDQENDVSYVLKEFDSAIESMEIELERLIAEKDMEETSLQDIVDKAKENVVRTENDIKTKKEQLRECEKKNAKVDSDLMDQMTSDDLLMNTTSKINHLEKTIYTLKNNFKEKEESQKTDSYKKDVQEMERNLEPLESEFRFLCQNDVTEGKIEFEKQLISEKQREMNKIKTKHSEDFKQLFGEEVPERNLKDAVLAIQRTADFTTKNLTEKISKKQKEVTTLEVQRQHQLDKIADCEKELKDKQKNILEVCSGKDFNDTLKTSFQNKVKLQNEKGQYSSLKIIFAQYIKEFEKESPCCPICETNFGQKENMVKKIIATLKNKLETVPQKLSEVEEDLKKEEDHYDKLQQLKTINSETESLKTETLPQLKNQLTEIDKNLKKHKAELDSLKTELLDPQKRVDISKKIISDVSSFDQHQNDVERSQRNVENLIRELVHVASKKSKQEVEAEIEVIKSELSELRMKIDSQVKKLSNHRDRLQQLMDDKNLMIEKQLKIKEKMQNKPALETLKIELEDKISKLNTEISDLQSDLYLLKAELQNAIQHKESQVKISRGLIEEKRVELAERKSSVGNIKNLQAELESYISSNIDEKLSKTEENLEACKKKEETLEQTKATILDAISKKKEELAKQELNFQTLKSNEILREKKALEARLEQEVQSLKRRIGGHNYKTVYEEKQRLILQRENTEKEIYNFEGEKSELKKVIEDMRKELNQPENKNAYKNYMRKLHQLKVSEISNDDLYKYIVGLETAVLEFHRTKMIQINRNIRELWRNIYRGNDIDYIEIKTEHATGNAKRRSYDYKVVQVKKGVELDMRGRCSAGQKVLACLIIRIALAESLSANCGMLALDEPTTNLDKENIESLAETLSRIVNVRQGEKNFQLLIITHDEEFVKTITRTQGSSHFYRVERDTDGFSCVKRETCL